MSSLKDELVGYCTLAVMALLGMALYSGTYSLIYASIGINEPAVAILEMWMTSVHLFSAVGCCIVQGVYAGVWKQHDNMGLPHLAEAQTSLFLGMACAVTILGNNCLQHGDCAAYYGAAGFPRMAAAGSVAWVWIMYISSLGCQPWTKGVSLGFNEKQGLTAASVMIMLPPTVSEKLSSTCGWAHMCDGSGCDSVLPILLLLFGVLLCHGGSCIARIAHTNGGLLMRILGCIVFLFSIFFMPSALWGGGYNITALVLAGNSLVSELWRAPKSPRAGGGFNLSGIRRKIGATLFDPKTAARGAKAHP